VGAYLLQAGGEIVVGPVGLALAARLAPPGRTGQFLGLYGLFAAFGVVLGNGLYRLTGRVPLSVYFLLCGGSVIAVAAVLATASPALDRLLRAGRPSA
jgi:POT family proton-dependent oligopeptide transporter